jgi:phage terminase small subunit
LTPKQECFARAYVEIGNASDAYRRCYNAKKMKLESIHRLAFAVLINLKVASRIERIQNEARERHAITVDSLTEQAQGAIALAMEQGQASAAVAGVALLAKLHGLLTDRARIDVRATSPPAIYVSHVKPRKHRPPLLENKAE